MTSSNRILSRYFARLYPSRESWLSGRLVRRGEVELGEVISPWLLTQADGFTLLDAGCGDGGFLSTILSSTPDLLRLEDLSQVAVGTAGQRLAGRARRVEVCARDSRIDDGARFDVTLAIGVLDYHGDWASLLDGLVSRTRRVLIFDVPRAGVIHHALRRVWLRTLGIELQTFSAEKFERVVASLSHEYRFASTHFSYVARVELE